MNASAHNLAEEAATKRKKKNRRLTLATVAETAECHDEVFRRLLSVMPEESPVDREEHAALITLEVYRARESRRYPPWREQPDFEGAA